MNKKLPYVYGNPEEIEVGDVITSPTFEFAYQKNGHLYIEYKRNKKITEKIIQRQFSERTRLEIAAKTGNPNPPKSEPLDIGSYDPTRAQAQFIVMSAQLESETTDSYGPYDGYTTIFSATITAKRLNKDGTYNTEGEEIIFEVAGKRQVSIRPENITKIGTMKKVFVVNNDDTDENKKLPQRYTFTQDIRLHDVIMSPAFIFAYKENGSLQIEWDYGKEIKEKIIHQKLSLKERLEIAAKTGNACPPEYKPINIGSHDPTRAQAHFVVESLEYLPIKEVSYGRDDSNIDDSPIIVTARRLFKNDIYNPKGEVIMFKVACWTIHPYDITKVAKMQNTYIKVDKDEKE